MMLLTPNRVSRFILFWLLAWAAVIPVLHAAESLPVKTTEWHGYTQLNFSVAGRDCLLVVPNNPAPGKPWIWRAEWFGDPHAPQVDLALLERGWHVAYMSASDLYGAPKAIALFDAYYRHVVAHHGLARKFVMEGFSRGGLYAFNFAATYPDRVSAMYLDAPALDLLSWPGRKHPLWQECLAAYGLSDAEADSAKVSPLDRIEPVVRAGIPIFGVSGDADEAVAYEDNLAKLAKKYRALGGTIEVIVKPGGKHHPHSLPDPSPIVAFLEKYGRADSLHSRP